MERWYAYWARFITTRVFPPTSLSVPESADTRLCNRPDYAQKPAWVSMVKPCEAWKRAGRRRTARKHFVGVTQFRTVPGMGGVQKSRGNGSNRLYLARQFESQIIDLCKRINIWVSRLEMPPRPPEGFTGAAGSQSEPGRGPRKKGAGFLRSDNRACESCVMYLRTVASKEVIGHTHRASLKFHLPFSI